MHSNTVGDESKRIRQRINQSAHENKFDKTEFSDHIPTKDLKSYSAQAMEKPTGLFTVTI